MGELSYRFGPLLEGNQTRFRVWAPGASKAELVLKDGAAVAMDKTSDGFFEALVECGPGTRYKFRIGGIEFPDLASR
jgi:maltooligosyltrehalose trehalohydrolase